MASHMAWHQKSVHKVASFVQFRDRKCHGCMVVVSPDQLVEHVACQPITKDYEATLKRKAPTDAKTGKSTSIAKLVKYKVI